MGPACNSDKTRIFGVKERIPQEAPHRNRTLSAPRTLTLQGEGGGGAMDGGGGASPDATICIAPGPGPIVAVAPAGISKLPQPFLPFPSRQAHLTLADSHIF